MDLLSQLLSYYHLTLKDLDARSASGSFQHLDTPKDCPAFKKVMQRLNAAKEQKEKTVIYGDYDVDGLTSTAIMKMAMEEVGIPCGYFVPSRYKEGYGLNASRVEEFAKKGYRLIVTVDNGISAFDAVKKARELGMEVIIIDHHEIPEQTVDTPYVFHFRSEGFLSYPCSAASLAFFVACSLVRRYDPYFATLAGIAVFSDVMPLVGNNLELSKIMFESLHKNRYPNLMYLLGNNPFFTYEDISFTLIPSLNAPGRICKDSLSTNQACRFLTETKDKEWIASHGKSIFEINQRRKDIVKSMTFQSRLDSLHAVVAIADDYSGLTGLFANRILTETKKSVIVFAPVENDAEKLVGSIRVMPGHNAMEFVHKHERFFLASGGHPYAAGVTIQKKDYFQVATLFATDMSSLETEVPQEARTVELDLEDLNEANFAIYQRFEPFGEGFPAPLFSLNLEKERFAMTESRKAAFAFSASGNGKVTLFSNLDLLSSDAEVLTVHGKFKKEVFRGKESYVLLAESIQKFM